MLSDWHVRLGFTTMFAALFIIAFYAQHLHDRITRLERHTHEIDHLMPPHGDPQHGVSEPIEETDQ